MGYLDRVDISTLKGEILINIEINKDWDEMYFHTESGKTFKMYHSQDCCESVDIDDIAGDLKDLLNSPITLAEEVTSNDIPSKYEDPESYTWTFYKLATIKGYVTIRWYGSSNGYYSESVDFELIKTSIDHAD